MREMLFCKQAHIWQPHNFEDITNTVYSQFGNLVDHNIHWT